MYFYKKAKPFIMASALLYENQKINKNKTIKKHNYMSYFHTCTIY